MARYRLLAPTFIGQGAHGTLRAAGEIVEYGGKPGKTMEPLDPPVVEEVEGLAEVAIPEDWEQKNGLQKIALAKTLGGAGQLNKQQAAEIIRQEIAKRAAAPSELPEPLAAPDAGE